MKAPDLVSTFIAALIGALALLAAVAFIHARGWDSCEGETNWPLAAATGAVVGAAVQVGVRVTGVS